MRQPLVIDDALRRIRGEYLEMPGLRLTTQQAQRLWNLDHVTCEVLLNALVDTQFLWRTADGAFVRYDPGSPGRPGPAASRQTIAVLEPASPGLARA